GGGARPAERIAVHALLPPAFLAAALLALHGLLHLLHHVLRAAPQRLQGPALFADAPFALRIAERPAGFAHGLACLAETFTRLNAQAFQPLHHLAKLTLELALALLHLAQRLGQLLGRHLSALSLLALLVLSLLALLTLLPLFALL